MNRRDMLKGIAAGSLGASLAECEIEEVEKKPNARIQCPHCNHWIKDVVGIWCDNCHKKNYRIGDKVRYYLTGDEEWLPDTIKVPKRLGNGTITDCLDRPNRPDQYGVRFGNGKRYCFPGISLLPAEYENGKPYP